MTSISQPKQSPRTKVRLPHFSAGKIILFLVTAILAILTIIPLLWLLSGTFKGADETYTVYLIPKHPTFSNITYVFTSVPFLRYMFNSFFIAGTITVAALWFHSMAGYALARLHFPGRETIFLLIFATFLVSLPVILVPLFILVKTLGILNSYAGLIIPATFNAFGIFLLRQFYLGIPRELEEAAILDGAGYWRVYWNLILPLSRPILAALAVFFFVVNWNAFLWPLTITNNQSLWVVQLAISSFQQQYASSQNYIMAASAIVAAPTVLLFFLFQKQLVESIKASGLK